MLEILRAWLGVAAGISAGAALALLLAVLVVSFKANQVVTGLALVIFAIGLTGYLGESRGGRSSSGDLRAD